eukprot:TRINITY_DN2371_c0_g1_i1.p1 TRINITY_DN2371_c0_g1~~TRINITY_DN2371_c0_g1_i1.p1  ORF type:complete len:219 (+),score=68.03 TRINITY_DN2371_c0_g1_i1:180-836(+)
MSHGLPQDVEWMTKAHDMGTSIIAVAYNGGVVIGADSRTTTGAYISNRISDKLTPLHEKIFVCRSGSAADTQFVSELVTWFLEEHSVELNEPPLVKSAANVLARVVYNNKHLLASLIVAGWDKHEGGSVYCIPIGGTLLKEPFAIGGSGSTYVYGYCDAHYRPNMTKEECEAFVVSALSLAMARDGSSGGVIRTATIDSTGVVRRMVQPKSFPVAWDG